MNKVEIFLPLPGMTEAMNSYFDQPNVIRPGGLPTGRELFTAGLSETELLEIAAEAAQDKVDEDTRWATENYTVDSEDPFYSEFLDEKGVQIGWEFEFRVYED